MKILVNPSWIYGIMDSTADNLLLSEVKYMESILDFFRESPETFTIYVVEQRFAVGRGHEYFKSFKGKHNYISSVEAIEKRIGTLLRWIQKNVPNVADIVKGIILSQTNPLSIADIISSMSKLFAVHEHQAAGPEVIDPLIIQEGAISSRHISQIITLHRSSILQPVIIIILKDNDFERAKELLKTCPHNINAKMIRNSGHNEIYRIINPGTDSISDFLDAFSRQCFSTCSRTNRDVLTNEDWAGNSLTDKFSPLVFKIRSNLLLDDKLDAKPDIEALLDMLELEDLQYSRSEEKILKTFHCMAKLFRVYANDFGGSDINDALELAQDLENEVLLAHVYRYAHFLPNLNQETKIELLNRATQIFTQNKIEDHSIYCRNNSLTYQFYNDKINYRAFHALQEEAVNNVPGLVGMSLIYNNTGVAYLYSGRSEDAIRYFEKGLDYSRDRIIQQIALKSNILIAKAYNYEEISENEYRRLIKLIFNTCPINYVPFLIANYVVNIISLCAKTKPELASEFIDAYPIVQLINNALLPGQFGSASLTYQLNKLERSLKKFPIEQIRTPAKVSQLSGIRKSFLINNGTNPTIFNAWL